jgi:POT family proton-dependent oligopeptide transporter
MVYMTTLPGGWIADRLIGQRRAVLYGGIIIAAGHFSMAFSSLSTFYLGLFLIVIGTGLLKGNVSVIVGQLYSKEDTRRDAGFSIFYMGINLGAFIAPIVCGYLGQRVSWHTGFAAAGVGMTIGVIQYVLGGRNLGDAGLHPAPAASPHAAARLRRNAGIVGGLLLAAHRLARSRSARCRSRTPRECCCSRSWSFSSDGCSPAATGRPTSGRSCMRLAYYFSPRACSGRCSSRQDRR